MCTRTHHQRSKSFQNFVEENLTTDAGRVDAVAVVVVVAAAAAASAVVVVRVEVVVVVYQARVL